MNTVRVGAGDTLSRIARQQLEAAGATPTDAQVKGLVGQIAELNNIHDVNKIKPGQTLQIPAVFEGIRTGPAPQVGAGAAGEVSGRNSVFGALAGQKAPAPRLVGDELVATTLNGAKVNLGNLNGGSSIGNFRETPDGKQVLFTRGTGGGFENENQSLFAFDRASGQVRPLLNKADNVAMIDVEGAQFFRGANKEWLMAVSESDGGLGAGNTYVFDVASGKNLGHIEGHLKADSKVSHDGKFTLSVTTEEAEGVDKTVSLKDLVKPATITDVQLKEDNLLKATVGGKVHELGQLAGGGSLGRAWDVPPGGQALLYSKNTGGGFENENQTLFMFDAASGKSTPLLGEKQGVAIFDRIDFVTADNGHLLALASESNGGSGAGNVHAVDLTTGKVLGKVPGGVESISTSGFGGELNLNVFNEATGDFEKKKLPLDKLVTLKGSHADSFEDA